MKKIRKSSMFQFVIVIMAAALFWATMPRTSQAQPNDIIPKADYLIDRYADVDNYPTGTNIVTPYQEQKMQVVKATLDEDPNVVALCVGKVSDKPIKGGCWIDPSDPGYFWMKTTEETRPGPRNGTIYRKGNDECQTALAISRAYTVRDWLIAHGIDGKRVFIWKFGALTMKNGGNLANQGVLVTFFSPEQLQNFSSVVVLDNGCEPSQGCEKPEIEVQIKPTCCTQTMSSEMVGNKLKISIMADCTKCQEPKTTAKQCHWYYQWPCMSKEEKVALITLGIVGGVALAVCSPHGGTGASKDKAGDGGGCRW